ncbi:hypothetical protein K1719_037338 [Acacia pycnantha]|nr:hypothetical protein K1719_037338 [Acacia pycnantha]
MYQQEEPVTLWVNKAGPYNNPQETYNYYSLPFCHPSDNLAHKWGGLGEVLGGNELIDRQIDIKFRNDLPLWGFVGELRPDKNSDNGKHFLFTHKNILIKYNQDQIIHVNLTQEGPKPLEGSLLDLSLSLNVHIHVALPLAFVHGDVFRPPHNLVILSAVVGTGAQLALLVLLVILLAIVGMLYVGRGAIVTTFIVCYALTSFISGYVSGGMYSRHGGKSWIKSMILTASLFPFAQRKNSRKNQGFAGSYDELADNGVSLLTVKVRVMPSSWFLLLRFWLRVDGVLIRLRDTRLHCIFGGAENPVILRETCWRESTFEALSMIFGTEAAYLEEDIDLGRDALAGYLLSHVDDV